MKQLSQNLMCIKMRSGIEIWVERQKAEKLIHLLGTTKTKFVEIENEIINSVDIEGIFTPQTMEALTRRKNGEWQCNYGHWHDRNDNCAHGELEKYNKNKKTNL